MYYYVYDEFVQDAKYDKLRAAIETRMTDLGISGKIARLALFRDAGELIRDEVKRGATTIIAVGNDDTLQKVIDPAASAGASIGIIPIGASNQTIAAMLGIPAGEAACEVLAARQIEAIDVGLVNKRYFLHEAHIPLHGGLEIICDESYRLSAKTGTIELRNLAFGDDIVPPGNPIDGKIDFVKRYTKKGWFSKKKEVATWIPMKNLHIRSENMIKMTIDGGIFEARELNISIVTGAMQLITGKDRIF
ncbi:MAG: diacylglycerol kinase family protein [bacterium]|nr:diacylglycerol kinase family protein [bacterium]